MTTRQTMSKYNIPREIQANIQLFNIEKNNFNKVLNELKLLYIKRFWMN